MFHKNNLNWVVIALCLTAASMSWAQVASRAGSSTPSGPAASPPKPAETPSYMIQPNDVLQIFVWKDPTVSRDRILVRPDGRISLPLVQDLQAAGMSPIQLKESLEDRLKEYINVPNVTVIVDSIQSYRIYLMGNVANPGALTNATPLTIVQALATAGGFREFADKSDVQILRGTRRIRFNYEEYIKGKPGAQDIPLLSGDVVNVQ